MAGPVTDTMKELAIKFSFSGEDSPYYSSFSMKSPLRHFFRLITALLPTWKKQLPISYNRIHRYHKTTTGLTLLHLEWPKLYGV